MRHTFVLIASLFTVACASSPAESGQPIDPQAGSPAQAAGCYTLQLGGEPSPDVSLPTLIELSQEPAPGFVAPGRFAVREPGRSAPQAPFSWWAPRGPNAIELALGGGFTGYTFSLTAEPDGAWVGEGVYCADMGLEPTPGPLPARLTPRTCP
jgi:hypothetical protein